MNINSWLGHVFWRLVSSSAQTLISTSSNFTITIITLANNPTLIPYFIYHHFLYLTFLTTNLTLPVCVFSVVVVALFFFFFLLLTDTVPYAPLRLTPLHFGYGSCSALTHSLTCTPSFFFLNFFSKCAHCSGHLKPFCLAHFLLVVRLNNQT
ncbi:hypothetical protein D499_0AQ00260 [Hanseniaspora uvarum DSM 2768]|nr:hypothetical protein D499_0AQ00260 [Hanseniaspora uvarum DSM 2768]